MSASSVEPDSRTRILDAADRLLVRYGYRKMTVDDIAREAGIGKGSVYLSFRSKEDVALGCLDRMVDELCERLRAIAAGSGTPGTRLRTMLRARVLHRFDYARQHSSSVDDMLASLRASLLARRADYFEREAVIFAALLREGRQAGAFRAGEPLAAARVLVLATNALLPYSLSTRELGRRSEVEARVDMLSDLLLAGLAASGARAVRRPRPAGAAHPSSRSRRTSRP